MSPAQAHPSPKRGVSWQVRRDCVRTESHMSHVALINESCHTMSHVALINESCHTMSHVALINESCHTYHSVISRMSQTRCALASS